jgi:hypothetical protein
MISLQRYGPLKKYHDFSISTSKEKTLTASEVDAPMDAVYNACSESGREVR